MSTQSPSSTELPRGENAADPATSAPDSPPDEKKQAGGKRPSQKPPAADADDAAVETAEAADAPQEEEAAEQDQPVAHRFLLFAAVPSWLVSMIFHVVVLLLLALFSFAPDVKNLRRILTVNNSEETEEIEEFEVEEFEPIEVEPMETFDMALTSPTEMAPQEVTDVAISDDVDAPPVSVELIDFSETTAPKADLLAQAGSVSGSGLEGRGAGSRGKMVAKYGGNKESEEAVALALAWLAEHQLPDGSWSFDHRHGLCQGQCSHPGTLADARNGATAMALLPFLGAGQTHLEGKYKRNVEAGLYFLKQNMKISGNRGDWMAGGGSMYSHGLASIAMCEAYAMTHDKGLMAPAQLSLNHIVYAQDPVGGGWRYQVKQPGDTSVVGWQLMALKSGHMAYLHVPPHTVKMTSRFLDSVSVDSGAFYGYTGPGRGQATTAVGLLCRMYLGWDKEEGALQRGVAHFANRGPSINVARGQGSMYYNYYATQVMRHWGGKEWDAWNKVMRDGLVASQSKQGHTRGSWFLTGDHGAERGGRLYVTSMATMILEVYYRHMPIYGKAAAEEDFPL